MSAFQISVIVAEEVAAQNLPLLFEQLRPADYPQVEFIVCTGTPEAQLQGIPDLDNVRVLPATEGHRIPLLWRDGILAAKADLVALTTAHCVPAKDWLDRLFSYDFSGNLVAVGGAIENVESDTPHGRAIHMLRYVRYTKARNSGNADDLAADNAIYRKADILQHSDLLKIGFWEPSFHERFIANGLELKFDSDLLVVHHNCYGVQQFMAQRFEHAIEFGMARAKTMSFAKRLMMVVLSPLIPVVFARKILSTARKHGMKINLGSEFAWLLVFILAWAAGETIGYIKPEQE